MKTCNYLLNIHTLPQELAEPLNDPKHHLHETAQLYQRLVNSDLLWRVWQIDEYQSIWIEVNLINVDGKPVFHTLVIDEGTFDKVDFEEYPILEGEI
ncbi:MAG: hypothetical protein AAGJ18_03355 [Bacteroidota bacterium]